MRENILLKHNRISESQLADYWGVKRNTLQKWRSAGIGPAYIKIGARVIYTKDAIQEYERTRTFKDPGTRAFPTQGANDGK